jgi:hypothetical protein
VPILLDLHANVASMVEDARRPFHIGISALPPSVGKGEIAAELVYVIPQARLIYTGHTGPSPDQPLRLTGDDLEHGRQALNFRLDGAISQPIAREFTVTGGSRLVDHRLVVDGLTVHVVPVSTNWCICFVRFLPAQVVAVEWRHPSGIQSAKASAGYDIAPPVQEVAWSCGWLLLWLLLLVWIAMAILTMVRTHRFPRGSVAELTEGRQLPRNIDLRHRNWTAVRSFLPWHAWLLRPPHERTMIEGIVFEAAPNGATILMRSTAVDFMVVHLGQNSRDMLAINPNLDRLSVMWNAEIERDVGARLTIRLLRRMSDQSMRF